MNRIEKLIALLGEGTVLIPCAPGSKQPIIRDWQKLTAEVMSDSGHLKSLEKRNIGVALGDQSNGLCSIDFDEQGALDQFLDINPSLRETLITRGKRGANVWCRIRGAFPDTKKLFFSDRPVGEWRSNRSQTVITGTHPDGMKYRFINQAPPSELEYGTIVWPENCPLAAKPKDSVCCWGLKLIHTPGEAVEISLPDGFGQNHSSLFQLARAILTMQLNRGTPVSVAEKTEAFGIWYRSNRFLDPKQTRGVYLEEFFQSVATANIPIADEILKQAWSRANALSLPNQAGWSNEVFLLQKLCYVLQEHRGCSPFFLSVQSIVDLFSGTHHKPHWNSKLKALKGREIIHQVERGSLGSRKASEYIYPAHPVWSQSERAKRKLLQYLEINPVQRLVRS